MRYYVGIDGGGTKTAICAVGTDDSKVLCAKTQGSSWREHGAEKVARLLKDSVNALLGDNNGKIAGIALGLPCYGESEGGDRALELAVGKAFDGVAFYLTNDVEAGWAGSASLSPGINIVAGTGSVVFGRDIRGKTARSGGWSEFFGDEGSCYWMGRKVMELFSKQSDGRLPRDALYDIVSRKFNLKNDLELIDLIHSRYMGSREKVAGLQLLAEKAALSGSFCAVKLYGEAADELCAMAAAVKDKLDFDGKPVNVSYSGGLFKAGGLILPRLSAGIKKIGGRLSAPRLDPVHGAVLLAAERFCPDELLSVLKILEDNKE